MTSSPDDLKREDEATESELRAYVATHVPAQYYPCLPVFFRLLDGERKRAQEAVRERDGARAESKSHAEHARRVAEECRNGLDALTDIDEAWAAIGTRGNRGHLTLGEQISVLTRE